MGKHVVIVLGGNVILRPNKMGNFGMSTDSISDVKKAGQ